MPRMRQPLAPKLGLIFLTILPLGCAQFDPVTNSTLVGSGLGTTAGAIIGHQSGSAGKGALIGAAAGALGGALVGDANQARAERDAAYDLAFSQKYQAAQGAVTNTDVIYMAQNGLSDEVILNAIHTRGGRFDTSPHSLISLKSAGVSESVIGAMQTAGSAPPLSYVPPPPPPPASILVVEPPRPRPIFLGHFDDCHHHRFRHPRRHRQGSSISIHGHF